MGHGGGMRTTSRGVAPRGGDAVEGPDGRRWPVRWACMHACRARPGAQACGWAGAVQGRMCASPSPARVDSVEPHARAPPQCGLGGAAPTPSVCEWDGVRGMDGWGWVMESWLGLKS